MTRDEQGMHENGEDDSLHVDGLSPRQERALAALLDEPTLSKAAKACGVGRKTLYRWMQEPAFSNAYRAARREAFQQTVAMAHRYAPMALQTLARIASDQSAPHSARVSASTALLKHSRDSMETDDLAARVEALERAMKDSEAHRPGGLRAA